MRYCFFCAGLVPERACQVAPDGDQAREQNGRQVFSGCIARDGHVPRIHGWLDTESSPAQSFVQRNGRPAQSEFHGLSIATILRPVSAPTLNVPGRLSVTLNDVSSNFLCVHGSWESLVKNNIKSIVILLLCVTMNIQLIGTLFSRYLLISSYVKLKCIVVKSYFGTKHAQNKYSLYALVATSIK